MKLNEINYYKNREIDQSEYDKIPSQIEKPIRSTLKGSIKRPKEDWSKNRYGAFSTVLKDKRAPDAHKFSENDKAYRYFVNCVVNDPNARENPHFPRFYKVVSGGNGNDYYRMEKLYKTLREYCSETENIEKIINLYIKSNTDFYNKIIKLLYKQHNGVICHEIVDNFKIFPEDIISNHKFIEAIQLVTGKWMRNGVFRVINGLDLNPNNIMVRLTSTGPQLVITDPYT